MEAAVRKSGIENGVCILSTPHTTASISVNENEKGLCKDLLTFLEKLVPPGAGYLHDRIDNNADSHIKAMLLGSSKALPIREGKIELGTWQSIFFVELDGPRERIVNLTLLGAQ